MTKREASPEHPRSPMVCDPAADLFVRPNSVRWWYPKIGCPERRHLYVEVVTSAASAAPEPTRLVLIRHGESRSTVDRVVGGHEGCSGLTDRGVLQAKALYERLARTGELAGATALLTSVLPRAIQTAEIIAPALGDLTRRAALRAVRDPPRRGRRARRGRSSAPGTAPKGWPRGTPTRPWLPRGRVGPASSSGSGRRCSGRLPTTPARRWSWSATAGSSKAPSPPWAGSRCAAPSTSRIENTSLTGWSYHPAEGDLGNAGHRLARWRLDRFNDTAHLAGLD